MAHRILLVVPLLAACLFAAAQKSSYYTVDDASRTDEDVYLTDVERGTENTVLVAGYSNVYNPDAYSSGVLVSLDTTGAILWAKRYNYNDGVTFSTVLPYEGGYYLGGMLTQTGEESKALVVRIDEAGNILFSKTIEGVDDGFSITKIVPFKDGFLVNASEDSLFLIVFDSLGNFHALSRYHLGVEPEYMMCDGNDIYVMGYIYSGGNENETKGILVKLNADGTLIRRQTIKLASLAHMIVSAGYIHNNHEISVYADCATAFLENSKLLTLDLDSSGNEMAHNALYIGNAVKHSDYSFKNENLRGSCHWLDFDTSMVVNHYSSGTWVKKYSDQHFPKSLAVTDVSDSVITVVGYETLSKNGFIMNTGGDGNGCYAQDFQLDNYVNNVTITSSSDYTVADTEYVVSDIPITITEDIVTTVICNTGISGIHSVDPNSDISIFPNPCFDRFNIETGTSEPMVISIYDVSERLIYSSTVHGTFNGGDQLEPGAYLIELVTKKGERHTYKLIKLQP